MNNFIPGPGTYLVEISSDTPKGIIVNNKPQTRILNGKVIAIGDPLITDYGVAIGSPVKVGDHAYFLSYEGAYDNFKEGGKEYYTVQFKDHRGVKK